jgi:hypothetical protein
MKDPNVREIEDVAEEAIQTKNVELARHALEELKDCDDCDEQKDRLKAVISGKI